MTYFEKLKDPRWQRKRLEIMERDDFTCTFCGDSESTLNVHHCYYGKNRAPWDYENEHLITLCEECHKGVEAKRTEILKKLTWEVPLHSIHALATLCDPYFLWQIAAAYTGLENECALKLRAKSIRDAIAILDQMATQLETGNPSTEP